MIQPFGAAVLIEAAGGGDARGAQLLGFAAARVPLRRLCENVWRGAGEFYPRTNRTAVTEQWLRTQYLLRQLHLRLR